MDLRDLRAFLVVADELHFGRAAIRLHVTPSPLTRQIQRIERDLGVLLFERTRRSVALTPAGRELQVEARATLDRMDALPDRLQRIAHGATGLLKIGVIGIAIAAPARAMQARIRREMPDVRVTWRVNSSAEQVRGLRQGRLDVGFVHTPIEHDGLCVRPVVRDALVVALPAAHRHARRRKLRLSDLRDEIFLIGSREQSPGDYDRLITACNAEGFSPRLDAQPQSLLTFVGLVAIGAGVAVTPAAMSRSAIDGVVFVPVEGHDQFSEISIAWNPERVSPVLQRVLAWVEDAPG